MTHRCNLFCSFCWKFTDKATFGDVTDEQIEKFCEHLGHVETLYIRIAGGEPLIHPNFVDILSRLRQTFTDKRFLIVTNGILLTDELVSISNTRYIITVYSQNEHVAKKFVGRIGITRRAFHDRDYDSNLSDTQAQHVYSKCGYRQFRMIGDNLYGCCHSETLERIGRSPPVHEKVAKNCDTVLLARDDLWKACKHCFVSHLFL